MQQVSLPHEAHPTLIHFSQRPIQKHPWIVLHEASPEKQKRSREIGINHYPDAHLLSPVSPSKRRSSRPRPEITPLQNAGQAAQHHVNRCVVKSERARRKSVTKAKASQEVSTTSSEYVDVMRYLDRMASHPYRDASPVRSLHKVMPKIVHPTLPFRAPTKSQPACLVVDASKQHEHLTLQLTAVPIAQQLRKQSRARDAADLAQRSHNAANYAWLYPGNVLPVDVANHAFGQAKSVVNDAGHEITVRPELPHHSTCVM